MFDLEDAISKWKQRLLQQQDMSAENAEELEDHLRTTVQRLHARGSTERQAFMNATQRLGQLEEIAGEFRKLRPYGWNLLLPVAWVFYALSFLFPVHRDGATLLDGELPGWEAIHGAVVYGAAYGKVSVLTNLVMLLSPLALWDRARTALKPLLVSGVAATLLNGWWLVGHDPSHDLRTGYFLWWISFAIVSLGLFVRTRFSRFADDRTGSPTHSVPDPG